jgi:hypothetical protein
MEAYQERVIAERKELGAKTTALSAFISHQPTFHTLEPEERFLMRRQRNVMLEYCDILDERIARFPKEGE